MGSAQSDTGEFEPEIALISPWMSAWNCQLQSKIGVACSTLFWPIKRP